MPHSTERTSDVGETAHEHMTEKIARVLEPEAIAVIGASNTEGKRGHDTVRDLKEGAFDGDVYPVNPKYDEPILGLDVHASVTDIPATIDLAFIVTPASTIPPILEECGDADVPGAVVLASGFSEADEADLEREVVETAIDNDVYVLGPNSQGFANGDDLNLMGGYHVPDGSVAHVTQSGDVALILSSEAAATGSNGFSFNVDIGNEANLRFHQYLPMLDAHEGTDAIALYAEGMADGRQFLRTAREIVPETPVVLLKGGQTDAGKQSAASHTGSIAGNADVVEAAYRQAGVVSVDSTEHVVPVATTLAELSPPDGNRVAVLSDSGGHATLAADAIARTDELELADLTPETETRLQEAVPVAPNVANPVDIVGIQGDSGDLSIYHTTAEILVEDPNVDLLLVAGTLGGYDEYGPELGENNEVEVARQVARLDDEHDIPLVVQSMYGKQGSAALDAVEEEGVPALGSVDTAVECLASLAAYGRHLRTADEKTDFTFDREGGPRHEAVAEAREAGRTQLSEWESKRLLRSHDLPVVPTELATTPAEAATAAASIDGSVAMKIASPDIVHKTDVGGVALDIAAADARDTYDELIESATSHHPDADIDGVLVSPMLDDGVELIVGVVDDEETGPAVMVGLGGIFVEALEDVSFRSLPVTEFEAREMLDELAASDVLDGMRGRPAVDRDAVVDLLCGVSDLVAATPGIDELDLNPVLTTDSGVSVVDASVTLADEP